MCMIIYPTLARNTIRNRTIYGTKITAVFGEQHEFIIENVFCNIIL